jgi:UDP-N-acetylmuramate dehydrogenase
MPKLQTGVPLALHTTFRIGGPARLYTEPEALPELEESIAWALSEGVPFFLLGGGSNVLVHDSGFDGLVINSRKLSRVSFDGETVSAECGALVDDLAETCAGRSLTGIEFAAGLPGTVGGALYMNARAYEGSFSSIVERVSALEVEGKEVHERALEGTLLGFGYKRSVFQRGGVFVKEVRFRLSRGVHDSIVRNTEENRRKREAMGQYLFPNAGCIFKNDYRVGVPSGKIIEELGLKGKRIGNAEVFEKHANFIINRGGASAEDVYRLIRYVEGEVERKRGIRLEREILLVGPWSEDS